MFQGYLAYEQETVQVIHDITHISIARTHSILAHTILIQNICATLTTFLPIQTEKCPKSLYSQNMYFLGTEAEELVSQKTLPNRYSNFQI